MPTNKPAYAWPSDGAGSALARLKDMTWWTRPREAIDYLAGQMEGAHLLSLYRHYFPAAYTNSRASLRVRPSSAHSPREVEFIRLVGERLFPVADIGFELADERLDYIPVETLALEDEQMDAWKPVWLILYSLVQGPPGTLLDWDSLLEAFPGVTLTRPLFVTEEKLSYQVDWKRFFRRVAARYRGHAKGIRLACLYAGYATDNAFLDTTSDTLSYSVLPTWTRAEINALTAEWRRAKRMLVEIDAAADWLATEPVQLDRLIQLWNDCTTITHEPNHTKGEAV
jgi:hypothetical protein